VKRWWPHGNGPKDAGLSRVQKRSQRKRTKMSKITTRKRRERREEREKRDEWRRDEPTWEEVESLKSAGVVLNQPS